MGRQTHRNARRGPVSRRDLLDAKFCKIVRSRVLPSHGSRLNPQYNEMELAQMTAPFNQSDPSRNVMSRLAVRVREMRKARKMPRRVLSEKSGVSPRYLAQLEAGEGNISIALLQRVAAALDTRAEDLIADVPLPGSEAMQIANRYQAAPETGRAEVRRLLVTPGSPRSRAGRICLVGLRGAGKTTLGRLASEALGLRFVELTSEIEAANEMPVPEILALYGADGYRRLEAEVLEKVLSAHDRFILAVAGGIVAAPKTYESVLKSCHTIWLRATPGEHMERVRAQGDLRPMAGNPKAMTQLRELLVTRSADYERAEAQLDTSNRSVSTSLNDLLAVIASHGFLDQ